jgi:hypothetical protein
MSTKEVEESIKTQLDALRPSIFEAYRRDVWCSTQIGEALNSMRKLLLSSRKADRALLSLVIPPVQFEVSEFDSGDCSLRGSEAFRVYCQLYHAVSPDEPIPDIAVRGGESDDA